MNESNIDRLLQLTAPRTERTASLAPRDLTSLPVFSEQLWQLTAPANPRAYDEPPTARDTIQSAPRSQGLDRPSSSPPTYAQPGGPADQRREPVTTSDKHASSTTPAVEDGDAAHVRHGESGDDKDPRDNADQQDGADKADTSAIAATPVSHAKTAPASRGGDASTDASAAPATEDGAADPASPNARVTQQGENSDVQVTAGAESDAAHLLPSTPILVQTESAEGAHGGAKGPDGVGVSNASQNGATSDDLAIAANTPISAAAAASSEKSFQTEIEVAGAAAITAERRAALRGSKLPSAAAAAIEEQTATAQIVAGDEPDKNKSADASETDGQNGRTADGAAHNRGKEPIAKTTQDSAQQAAVAVPVSVPSAAEAASTSDASPVSPVDEKSQPVSPSAAARAEAWTTTFARGPRGGSPGPVKDAPELSRVDAARFVGRVTRAFHVAQERGGTLQLRLSPPELGSLQMELTLKDGVLNARLEAETSAARRLLLDHLPALRDRLAEQNVRVERFDVNVRREGNEGRPDVPQQQQQQQRSPQRQPQQASASRRTNEQSPIDDRVTIVDRPAQPATTKSGINLIV